MQRLSGMDATFLYLETPTNHMHVAATAVLDPSDVPGGYSFDRFRDLVESRLHLVPPFRRRLAEIPFQLHHPLWVEDPDFDIEYHLRRAALPSPGGERELAEFAADVMSRPLDRTKPLWEMYVVEGLEHGMIAVVAKTHHAAIDGISGAELMVALLDLGPEPAPAPPPPEWRPERVPTDLELVAFALSSLSRQPLAGLKAARRTVEAALTLRRRNRLPEVSPPPAPFSAPRTSINTAITPHRKFAFTQVPLDDAKAIKRALGGTVNDVVLALCAGALRSYLVARDEPVEESLVALVPISVRDGGRQGDGTLGNKIGQLLVSLGTAIHDPVERLRAIADSTRHAKSQSNAIGADILTNWAEFAAPAVFARAARLYTNMKLADRHRPLFNLTVSNVPGPQFPLYIAGTRLVALYPMGPVSDGGALNITAMSYMGNLYFGLVACREAVPHVDTIAAGISSSLDELLKAAAAGA
ncbi:MAG TPA: wax ester/triacylglycerol synthase family O-acyltransferase [Acidimicrobiales bacterium]|nr:wax ester/triacylglycerol synthase family O-acyltransferase [Acidimicrobiales bacterium]